VKRTTISLLATAAALAAVTGVAAVTAPTADGDDTGPAGKTAAAPARLPVERSTLVCPAPGGAVAGETVYTSYTPATGPGSGTGSGAAGKPASAGLRPAAPPAPVPGTDRKPADSDSTTAPGAGRPAPVLTLKQPGTPAGAENDDADAPALVGTATGALAPGWTAHQTTTVTTGEARGLLGTGCTAPGTEFWFPGASTAKERQDYIHLANPDETAAVVDIELYGKAGPVPADGGDAIGVPAGGSVPILLSSLTSEAESDLTVRVTTRSGRIGAAVRAAEEKAGSDWLPAGAPPTGTVVLPGIPADATSVRLIAHAPGRDDADLKVELSGPGGRIVPAGAESLRVKAGMTATLELGEVTRGEGGSLVLSPAQGGPVPLVAALRVVRGKGAKQEIAFIPASAPVGDRASVADNRAKGTTLTLTAPAAAARVKVTASAGTGGGTPATTTHELKAGATLALTAPAPEGIKGSYALTVETVSGGPVHAARTLALPEDGVEMFTVQTFSYDRGTVAVPRAKQDLSVLDD
jgi:hypothetical protein